MSSLPKDTRQSLEKNLASLIGFDDGCDGVLDHLLTIENKRDLKEYLNQLLGDDNANINNFIERLWDSKQGNIKAAAWSSVESQSDSPQTDPLPSRRADDVNRSIKPKDIHPQNPSKSQEQGLLKSNNLLGKDSKADIFVEQKQQQSHRQQQAKEQRQREQEELKRIHQQSLDRLKVKHKEDKADSTILPPRNKGKPKVPCGCYGTRHRPLINCLFCGRIACDLEGYADCNFCGNPLEEIGKQTREEFSQDAAWKQKELMVQFDREYARRTIVYDDQTDYYSNSTSSWLTGKEREEETKKDESKRRELHNRDLVMKLGI